MILALQDNKTARNTSGPKSIIEPLPLAEPAFMVMTSGDYEKKPGRGNALAAETVDRTRLPLEPFVSYEVIDKTEDLSLERRFKVIDAA